MRCTRFHLPLAALLITGGVFACSQVTEPPRPTTAVNFTPLHSVIPATDSNLVQTSIAYEDTTQVLTRLVPLAAPLTASADIGSAGGELRIDAAGVRLVFPARALATTTRITITAAAGEHVAYELEPHGISFSRPVRLEQTLTGTHADGNSTLLQGIGGAYYAQSLDSAFTGGTRKFAKVLEHQLGYLDPTKTTVKIFIGHFSGYLVASGRGPREQ